MKPESWPAVVAALVALAVAVAVGGIVAVQSGGQLSGGDGGSRPISPLGVHGIRDSDLGISGGRPVEWAAFDEGHRAAPQDGAGGDSGNRTWVPGEIRKFFTRS